MTSRPLHQIYLEKKADGSDPDPAIFCPTNGYIDPTLPNDDWLILPKIVKPGYGLLYNDYACIRTGSNSLSMSDDWVRFSGQSVYVGSDKETGTTYWDTPNLGATNARGLNIRGCGYRNGSTGGFTGLNQYYFIRFSATTDYSFFTYNTAYLGVGNGGDRNKMGFPQRFINYNTSLSVGQSGIYTGNDGKKYLTRCYALSGAPYKFEIMVIDLAETKYRDGSNIPEVIDNAAWAALTTGALCAYNNDWSNV